MRTLFARHMQNQGGSLATRSVRVGRSARYTVLALLGVACSANSPATEHSTDLSEKDKDSELTKGSASPGTDPPALTEETGTADTLEPSPLVSDTDDALFDSTTLPEGCGDGLLSDDEACDDGNRLAGDGCADCREVEQGYECPTAGAPCERTDVCGDSIVSGLETCDDGNPTPGDGCSAGCFLERDFACPTPGEACVSTVVCGDGQVSGTETCDDGNTRSSDGCSADCELEPGYNCSSSGFACVSSCGDGVLTSQESCDDGNTQSGDGCSSGCVRESGYACPMGGIACHPSVCGDGIAEGDEPCDDGDNTDMGDGCSPGCRLEPDCSQGECHSRCGDGLILAGDNESCDDGNNQDGDGCSADCQIEAGFECEVLSDTDQGSLDLPVVYRDFISRGYDEVTLTDGRTFSGHPDFDAAVVEVKGMVELELAPKTDMLNRPFKPVYNAEVLSSLPDLVASRDSFNQWYSDDPSVNMTFVDVMTLTSTGDETFEFDDQTFFPLDGRGFSDPTLALDGVSTEYLTGLCDAPDEEHAFLFTSEVRYWFEYHGGEQLIFRGDDDVWVFIKNRLVVDLGGIHGAEGGDVCGNTFHPDFPLDCAGLSAETVDQGGTPLNLIEGQVYEIAVFQAERRACQSSYRLTLSGFTRLRTECKSTCGDGVTAGNERCDDGKNNGAGYGFCSVDCQPGPRCGDGVLNGAEECDNGLNMDGYQLSEDSCAPGCVRPAFCGDGVIDAAYGESCDNGEQDDAGQDGAGQGDPAYNGCTSECQLGPRCGDGQLNEPEEQCDDGNRVNNDGCNVNCRTERVLKIK